METKAFEVLDSATFIPVIATRMLPTASPGSEEGQGEYYLLRRAGFPMEEPALVMLCRMEARGAPHDASYDSYAWGGARTMQVAHNYIVRNWNTLRTGEVIDVEFILGETKTKKVSERISARLGSSH